MEFALMHATFASHRLMRHVPYIGFYAMFDTATWRYGVPLAMGPALFYATSRTTRVVPAAHLMTFALGAVFTVISSGWIGPPWPELIRSATEPPRHPTPLM